MKLTGKKIISLLLAAELLLGSIGVAGPIHAAETPLTGTPYSSNGSYDVNVSHIVVNQIYGGGTVTTTGGYFSNGFIELYNPTDTAVNLSGWSVQYSDPKMVAGEWSKLELSGTIQAHSSYLITDSKNDLSSPNDISGMGDQSWAEMRFYNQGMKVVLLSDTTPLENPNPFLNKPSGYVDMIGTAGNDEGLSIDGFESEYPTGKTGGTSKQKSVRRTDFSDTDNNKTDFKQISFDKLDAGTLNIVKPHNLAYGQWGVSQPALGISTSSLPEATVGSLYSVTLSVYGGTMPYSFKASSLPEGLSMDTLSGSISGTPVEESMATVSISVYDSSLPPLTAVALLPLNVAKGTPLLYQDKVSMSKIGGYSVGVSNEDGGVAEIVKYNPDNGRFYLVNGATNPATVDIVNLNNAVQPEKETSINIEQLSETDGFNYGDLTSLDINTETKRIAVSVQEEDAMKQGKVLILDYAGQLLGSYMTGVQPDMVKYTGDGSYILTADEGEPRTVEGDPEGSVTLINTVQNTVKIIKFDNPDLIDDLVHIRGAVNPDTKLITGTGTKEDAVRDLEPEFIELSEDEKTAYVSMQENNAIAAIDVATQTVLWVKGLGVKDLNMPNNALDLLKDKKIHLENVPFSGVYMPDGISEYTVDGKTYLFTANEGDATEWDSKENVSTVKAMKQLLKPESPASQFLAEHSEYDGVEVMSDMGNHDGIYMYGARSFSIWDADNLSQVYDSGSDFEKITAERLPDYFNASNSNTTLDSRSTKKGPEPEYVKIGKVGQKVLAFIGLERIGGLMTYDVTNPGQPSFINYMNSREFTPKDNLETDTGPEGIEFIPAPLSPTGLPLLLVANEIGGTVAVYQLNVAKVTVDQVSLSLKAGGSSTTLQATVVPADDGAVSVNWSTSDPSVATVDNTGRVTPIAQGSAVISAFSADGYGVAETNVKVASADPVGSSPGPGAVTGTDTISAVDTPAAIIEGNKAVIEVKTEMETPGIATAKYTLEMVESALKALGTVTGGEIVFRSVPDTATNEVKLTIPASAFTALVSSSLNTFTIEAGLGKVSWNRSALSAVSLAANGEDITISIANMDASTGINKLPSDLREGARMTINNRPVIDLTVRAGSREITSFGEGTAVVSIPYAPTAIEDVNAIVAYYLSDEAGLIPLSVSNYNSSTGALTFRTTHFSTYAVGYNNKVFTDVGSSFAKESITYLAARGIITGMGEGIFGAKLKLTRADATLLLAKIAGVDLNAEASGAFSDVKPNDYYSDAVAWAYRSGIVSGVGEERFNPKANITREQFSMMLVRFADTMNWEIPMNVEKAMFADQNLTREETAQMLAKLLKLDLDK